MSEKIFCVISHTHWDREWYMPLEQFRVRLVDLMDNLLKILEENEKYIFHLDAQTIVLEDYLEIRPSKREVLQSFIREGRVLAGPWYVQNDFYLTSGEATIRNLIIGSRIAEEMGKCTWEGYTPDQFGLISQLPQIFNGFGINSCIFGRGYNFYERKDEELEPVKMPSEFIWKGEDGSQVLAIHMPYWYNNAQRFSEDIGKSLKLLKMIENSFEGVALTPYLLLMNGVDHLEAQENLLPILEKMNTALEIQGQGKKTIVQMPMDAYVEHVRKTLPAVGEYLGEMRNGGDYSVLQGTLSSRIYLKVQNVKAQALLENKLEPVYSFIHMLGAKDRYPDDFMNYLWKLLIQNHPHDSICGCSRDEVHRHMEDRFQRIRETGEELLNRGMDFLAAHMDRKDLSDKDYLITLCNTVETERDAVAEIELEFPVEENVKSFRISGPDGQEIPTVLLSKKKKKKSLSSPINLPGIIEVDAYRVQLYLENLAGMSLQTLMVITSDMDAAVDESTGNADAVLPIKLENEYIAVVIRENGAIDLTYKETGKCYTNILSLEDCEDCGDSYVYRKSEKGRTFTSEGLKPEITCISNSVFETQYQLAYQLLLPAGFDKETGMRSENLVSNDIEIMIGLKKGSRWVDVGFNINNRSENHRLRALLKTGMECDFTWASTPFDSIKRDRREVLNGIKNGTQPNSGWVDICDGPEGFSVLNEGIYEYEHLLGDGGIIAMTLLRANGKIEVNSDSDVWQAPENQCIRNISLRMALFPHRGDWLEGGTAAKSKEFIVPVLQYFQPKDLRKFMGGRPAVQDSAISEIFYRKQPNSELVLPHHLSFFKLEGEDVEVSAVKKCEKGDGIVIRVYNSSHMEREVKFTCFRPLHEAQRLNMREETVSALVVNGNEVGPIRLKPKEICTVLVR